MNNLLVNVSLVSALSLALAYYPILNKLSFGLVSPYPKADTAKRLFAATVDVMLVAMALYYYHGFQSPRYLFLGIAYLLFRDAIGGRSVGKFVFGLFVVDLEAGLPSGFGASIRRNALFVLPGANVIAVFLEASTLLREPQGQRLGDRFALTQVVEGFGAKDLVIDVQQWLHELMEQLVDRLGDRVRKPGRVPVKR
jgi:uncharacterized RDD family membrane protein YckC